MPFGYCAHVLDHADAERGRDAGDEGAETKNRGLSPVVWGMTRDGVELLRTLFSAA